MIGICNIYSIFSLRCHKSLSLSDKLGTWKIMKPSDFSIRVFATNWRKISEHMEKGSSDCFHHEATIIFNRRNNYSKVTPRHTYCDGWSHSTWDYVYVALYTVGLSFFYTIITPRSHIKLHRMKKKLVFSTPCTAHAGLSHERPWNALNFFIATRG